MGVLKRIGLHTISFFLVCVCFTILEFIVNKILPALIYIRSEEKWMYAEPIIYIFSSSILLCLPGYLLYSAVESILNKNKWEGSGIVSGLCFLLGVFIFFTLMASGFMNNAHTVIFLLIIFLTGLISFNIKHKIFSSYNKV